MAKEKLCRDVSWVRIETGMLSDPKMVMIDGMKNRDLIHYIWTSSLLLAGQCNRGGMLYATSTLPYNYETLALIFRRSAKEIEKSFKVLIELEMIEVTESDVFKIKNWESHQNIESLERIRKQTKDRVAKYRQRKKEEKKTESDADDNFKESYINENVIDDLQEKKSRAMGNEKDNECDIYHNLEGERCSDGCKAQDIKCNVTDGKFKDAVTQENKKQNNNQRKNKNKDSDRKESMSVSLSDSEIDSSAIKMAGYCERIIGRIGVLDIGALRLAVSMHGEENVKQAIDEAIEAGKINMRYINGILKNWRREGYPKENGLGGEAYHGRKFNVKDDTKDTGKGRHIKARPRVLSNEKRAALEAKFI